MGVERNSLHANSGSSHPFEYFTASRIYPTQTDNPPLEDTLSCWSKRSKEYLSKQPTT